jgi:transcriptional regulator with GAF, ATPase, and Fis domain
VAADCRTILITGETGTGKEVVARAIHFQACRETDPLIAVSCAALPEALVESELFGHVKGAFTGATQDRVGYFELAHGSSLFLDEIGDLSPAAQAKMLRVLELRKLRRVGASEEIDVDVRVIVATNVPLDQLVEAGKFRRDLFYRLNLYTIDLLPLRERCEDILPLAERFLDQHRARRNAKVDGFSPAARDALRGYDYPGNARELRNVIQRAAILAHPGQIQPEHLNLGHIARHRTTADTVPSDADDERTRIMRALEQARWNRRDAAESLGMPYSTLRYKMQKLGLAK